jgi:hypothetical protein
VPDSKSLFVLTDMFAEAGTGRVLPILVCTCRSPVPVLLVAICLVEAHSVGET